MTTSQQQHSGHSELQTMHWPGEFNHWRGCQRSLEKVEKNGDEAKEQESPWAPGANVKFCEEVFGKANQQMDGSTQGKGFARESCVYN